MSSADEQPGTTYFRPERTHVVATILMTGIALIGISWAPLALGWLLIFPIVFIVWVLKAHTRITDDGISTNYLFRKNISVGWDKLAGVGFKGSRAVATTTSGEEFFLPGVSFNSLPKLAEASSGRIPDALTAGKDSIDGKVSVIHMDGREVLMTKEEHEAYLRSKEADSSTDNSQSTKE